MSEDILLLKDILTSIYERYKLHNVPAITTDIDKGKIKVTMKDEELFIDNLKSKKWFLSSCSPCKMNAVKTTISNINVVCEDSEFIKCESNVSEQPWERRETILGAWNRHLQLYKEIPLDNNNNLTKIFVTIENGLYPEQDGSLSNVAFIIMESINPCKFITKEVLCCNIPETLVIEYTAQKTENQKNIDEQQSFGMFLKSKDPSINPKDWSGRFHPLGHDRLKSLTQALSDMYVDLFR